MKIYITTDITKAPKDYLVLSPFVTTETDTIKKIDVKRLSLDEYAEDGELEEIILDNILDYVPITQVINVVNAVIKKLRHGGIVIVIGIDAYLVSKAFVDISMSIEQFNILLHGDNPDLLKTVNLTCQGVSNFLVENRLEILQRRIDIFQYSVKAKRP
jgi:hypothetical protein